MQKTADEVYQLIQELSEVEHIKLMELITGPPPTLHPAWGPELRRRVEQIDRGEVEMIPHEEVMAELDSLIDDLEAKHGPH